MRNLFATLLVLELLGAPTAALTCGMYIPKHEEKLLARAMDEIDKAEPAKPVSDAAPTVDKVTADTVNASAATAPVVKVEEAEEPAS